MQQSHEQGSVEKSVSSVIVSPAAILAVNLSVVSKNRPPHPPFGHLLPEGEGVSHPSRIHNANSSPSGRGCHGATGEGERENGKNHNGPNLRIQLAITGGFTFVELMIAIVISGILATVAMKSMFSIYGTAKTEETKQEMESLAYAIAGSPPAVNNGVRSDFGYVGDVGSLPPNLDALYTNPGGYTTWKGPYVSNRFTQTSDDYKRDAWGTLYEYTGGITIKSTGGGDMIRQIAGSPSQLLLNSVSGAVYDVDGTPPGLTYKDSLTVTLVYPNGTGGLRTKTTAIDAAGYFSFDSIPIGNQDLKIVYRPMNDTIERLASVAPHSFVSVACRFEEDLWFSPPVTGGTLIFVNGSDTTSGSSCQNVSFWATNTGGSAVTITSITVSWTGKTAYYKTIIWGATTVFDLGGSPRGVSGTTYTLTSVQTVGAGASVKISVLDFRRRNTSSGGNRRDMQNIPFTITFSNGSTLTFVTRELCN